MTVESMPHTVHPMPFTRIELVVLSVVDGRLAVLLARRAGAPHKGRWAVPGGVLRIDLDRDLESAAQRVAQERLNVPLPHLVQLLAVGSAKRDPRGWGLSIAYRALLPADAFHPVAGKRVEQLDWFGVDDDLADLAFAFDHRQLVEQAVAVVRHEVERMALPFDLVPEKFTLGELQATCEEVLGRTLDKSSFRRKLDERSLVVPVEGEMRTGAFRPAQVFRRA